jgi:hypothetical protein
MRRLGFVNKIGTPVMAAGNGRLGDCIRLVLTFSRLR